MHLHDLPLLASTPDPRSCVLSSGDTHALLGLLLKRRRAAEGKGDGTGPGRGHPPRQSKRRERSHTADRSNPAMATHARWCSGRTQRPKGEHVTGRRLHSPRKTGGGVLGDALARSGMLEPRNTLPQTQMLEKLCDLSRRVGITLKTCSRFLFNPNNFNRSLFKKWNSPKRIDVAQGQGRRAAWATPNGTRSFSLQIIYYCSW